MKVLLVNGSTHQAGSTHRILQEMEKTLHAEGVETSWFFLGAGAVHSCLDCGYCSEHDRCVHQDGVNELAELMKAADGVVLGSPVCYAGPNGALCALLDRVFYSAGDHFYGKPGASVVVCRRGGSTAALDRLNKYFTISRMPLVSSQYWNMVHGRNAQDVENDLEGLQTMRTLARDMIWMMKHLNVEEMPTAEDRVFTNFIR